MIRKLTLVAAFGAGYVLGAKAGTARYEQIAGQAQALLGRPEVQNATDKVQAKASDLADQAKDKAKDTASHAAHEAADAVRDKVADLNGSPASTSPLA